MRFSARFFVPSCVLLLSLAAPAALAAGSAIDPDPRSPSLGELLAREEAARETLARTKAATDKAAGDTAPVATLPAASAAAEPAVTMPRPPRSAVRQVYPAPAVTVWVPGGRTAPAR